MEIYKAPIVETVQRVHEAHVFSKALQFETMYAHLSAYAQTLCEQVQQKSNVAYCQINNYHPGYLGVATEQLADTALSFEDCQLTTAANFGFSDWEDVQKWGNVSYNFVFEEAVNSLISGEFENLEQLIDNNPALLTSTSQYGHRATLLHYVASNGVEMWRQQVPHNLPAITRVLLQNGADKTAKMHVYGGNFTTLELLETSAHPFEAGVGEQLVALLG